MIFSIGSSKSHGKDGFGAGFYKASWSIISRDVIAAVKYFFTTCKFPKAVSSTSLVLIPKIENPSSAKDYRPIACCSTLYKCTSKLICSRLIPNIVNENHGTFIKGRSLSHNIMILQDVLGSYDKRKVSPRCLLKVDLSKAYDTVSWSFVDDLSNALAFPSRFIT